MTAVFGSISLDGRQLFRQYPVMNTQTFLKYLACLKRKFKKFYFFYDGAPWHRSKPVTEFFEANRDCIIPIRFPVCSPEFNPTEECWRQGKNDILGSTFPPTFEDLKIQIAQYYRTRKFDLDVIKYLCH